MLSGAAQLLNNCSGCCVCKGYWHVMEFSSPHKMKTQTALDWFFIVEFMHVPIRKEGDKKSTTQLKICLHETQSLCRTTLFLKQNPS
jgi:hypothetical protein